MTKENEIRDNAKLVAKQFEGIFPPLKGEHLDLFKDQFTTPNQAMFFLDSLRNVWGDRSKPETRSFEAIADEMKTEVKHLGVVDRVALLLSMLSDGCFIFHEESQETWPVEAVKELAGKIVGPLSKESVIGLSHLDSELRDLGMGDYNTF